MTGKEKLYTLKIFNEDYEWVLDMQTELRKKGRRITKPELFQELRRVYEALRRNEQTQTLQASLAHEAHDEQREVIEMLRRVLKSQKHSGAMLTILRGLYQDVQDEEAKKKAG
jgi:type II secretory pathway predicted ATPase ExeA